MPLTIRSIKGTLLTNEELDNNFLYLEGLNTSKLNANAFTANNILSNLITVDGEGSELDADRLRGRIPTVAANVNSVVVRDGDGSIHANIVYASKITGNVSGLAEGITGILPITSGGTGSANIIGARQNLGLKAGATYNVTLNSVDSTPNSLLKVYDFGWGIDKPSATTTISDPNWTIPGNYGFNQVFGAAAGYPVGGTYDGGMLVVGAALNVGGTGSAGDIKRFAWTNSDELYFQGADAITAGVPAFGPWREVWHSGNSNVRAMKNSIDNKVDLQDYEPEDVLTKVKTANSAITLGSTKLGLGNTYASVLGMDNVSAANVIILTPPSTPSHAVSVSHLNTALNNKIPLGTIGQSLMIQTTGSNALKADYTVKIGQFIENNVELIAAKTRDFAEPIWDVRNGAGWFYENNAWAVDLEDTVWNTIGRGRILTDKYTRKTYFVNSDTTVQKIGVFANNIVLGTTNINLGDTIKNITGVDTISLTQWPSTASHATSKNYVDSVVNNASISNQNHANNAANGAYNSAVAYTNSAIQQSSGGHSFTIPSNQSANKDIWAIFGNGVDARTISVTIYGFVTQTNKWRLVPPGYNRVDDDVEVYTTDSRNLYFETSSRYNQYFITLRR